MTLSREQSETKAGFWFRLFFAVNRRSGKDMEFELIKCKDAHKYVGRSDAVFIDLREEERFREYHLPGAYSCPYELELDCTWRPAREQ